MRKNVERTRWSKKASKARKIAEEVAIENYAICNNLSIEEAKIVLEEKKKKYTSLYSKAASKGKKDLKVKIKRDHEVSKFDCTQVSLVQGGSPGLGKNK